MRDLQSRTFIEVYISLRHISMSRLKKAEQISSQSRCVTISSLDSQRLNISTFTSRYPPLDLSKLASQQDSSNAPVADGHLLPAPPSGDDAVKLDVSQGSASVKYDALGPLVVNNDGVSAPMIGF